MPLKRVTDESDPRRCKAASLDGQCRNISEEGYEYCLAHGGVASDGQEALRLYMLTRETEQHKLNKLVSHNGIKSLREEITLARILLEKIWNSVSEDTADILRSSGQINQILLTIERLVRSASLLEERSSVLLEKTTVIHIANAMCDTLTEELNGVENYELIIDKIHTRMCTIIAEAENEHTE